MAAGGSVPAEVLLVQTKINRKEVPAKDLGIKAVVFVTATCGLELKEIKVAPAQTVVVGATGTTVVVTAGNVVSTTVVAVGAGCGSANVETETGEETTFALSLATI